MLYFVLSQLFLWPFVWHLGFEQYSKIGRIKILWALRESSTFMYFLSFGSRYTILFAFVVVSVASSWNDRFVSRASSQNINGKLWFKSGGVEVNVVILLNVPIGEIAELSFKRWRSYHLDLLFVWYIVIAAASQYMRLSSANANVSLNVVNSSLMAILNKN